MTVTHCLVFCLIFADIEAERMVYVHVQLYPHILGMLRVEEYSVYSDVSK